MNREYLNREISRLKLRKSILIDYLKEKLVESDWHGVQDAASDIRDIDAELLGYHKILGAIDD